MKNLVWLIAIAAVVACGSSGNKNGDAAKAGSDGSGAGPITIMGTTISVASSGSANLAGATVAVYPASDTAGTGTPLAMTTSGSNGAYMLTVPAAAGMPGFLKASGNNYLDTYLWPPTPLTGSNYTGINVEMLEPSTVQLAASAFACNYSGYSSSDGLIGVELVSSFGTSGIGSKIAGGTVTATPAAGDTCYDNGSGTPSSSATVTAADGVALMFNVTPGSVTVSGSASGDTFASSQVYANGSALTATLIVEQ